MKRAMALARKEFRDVLRERSLVLALLVQFFIAAFSSFLVVGLVGLYDPGASPTHATSRVAYVGAGGFDAYLRGAPNLQVGAVDLAGALEGFRAGTYDAVIEETYATPGDARTVSLLLGQGEVKTTLLVTQVKSLLRDYERDLRFDREGRLQETVLYAESRAGANPYFGFAYAVLIPLLVIGPVFLSGAIAGDSIAQEIQTQTLHLLRASPLTPGEFLIGKLAGPAVLVPSQVLLWALLLRSNGLAIQNLVLLLGFSLILGVLLSAAAAAVACFTRGQAHSQAAYTLLVLVLFAFSMLVPRDPLNLVARIAAGSLDGPCALALGLFAFAALAACLAAWAAARHRFRTESA